MDSRTDGLFVTGHSLPSDAGYSITLNTPFVRTKTLFKGCRERRPARYGNAEEVHPLAGGLAVIAVQQGSPVNWMLVGR